MVASSKGELEENMVVYMTVEMNLTSAVPPSNIEELGEEVAISIIIAVATCAVDIKAREEAISLLLSP